MKIELDKDDLAPLISAAVRETLSQLDADQDLFGQRLAFDETEAAQMMGVARHTLRDARLRNEIEGCRIGKRIVYMREDLLKYLAEHRT